MTDDFQLRFFDNSKRETDIRNPYQKDYARIIHSAAFRRLQSKTQVLGLGESDFYRTRLTHSMEVSQLGCGIVKQLHHKYDPELNRKEVPSFDPKWLPCMSLISSICLAHDIGHPPFGHGGEVALNRCMLKSGGFEGNGQTLRILTKLGKYTEQNGLDLTRRTLLGVLKYPAPYSEVVKEGIYGKDDNQPSWLFRDKKFKPPKCYLDTERKEVSLILKPFSANDINLLTKSITDESGKHRKTQFKGLDTSIMEIADDVSYGFHDLEDSISLKMLTKEMWKAELAPEVEKFDEIFLEFKSGFTFDELTDDLFDRSHLRKRAIGGLINLLLSNVYIDEVPANFQHMLLKYNCFIPKQLEKIRRTIFDIVVKHVIKDENVQHLEFKGQKIVTELFDVFASDPERFLPSSTKERYKVCGSNDDKKRVICDFISGMTDDYATRFYEKIFVVGKGSIFERL